MGQLTDRMVRAARLEPALYEEVEADKTALGQAMGVVVLSSVAAGIGAVGTRGVGGIVTGAIGALVGWYIWAFLTYFIGTRLLPQPQTRTDRSLTTSLRQSSFEFTVQPRPIRSPRFWG
jgi:hypothetical protein